MATRHPSRWLLLPGLVLVVAAVAGAAVYRALSDGDGLPAPDDAGPTYTEAVVGTWSRVNPLYAPGNAADEDLVALIFAGLVRIGPDGDVQEDLADFPAISEDGMTYTFRLKPGLRWHDGVPLTSQDVAFTVRAVQSPAFDGSAALAAAWADIEVATPDLETVVFVLPAPSAPFLARTATLGILPQHLFEDVAGGGLGNAAFNTAPVGAGPYRLERLTAGEAVLRANPAYHFGRPRIETFRLRYYDDTASAAAALVAGEADGLFFSEPPSEELLATAAATGDLVAVRFNGTAHDILYLNNSQAAFFLDPRVRRAVDLAIDRVQLAALVPGSLAVPSSSPIPPGTWAYRSDFAHTNPDRATAAALLDAAGWQLNAGTGVRTRGGNEFRFTLRVDNDPVRIAMATSIAGQLEPLGIRVTVASTTRTILLREFLEPRRYDAAIFGWDQGPDPDPYPGWHSSQTGSGGLNLADFADLVVDTLVARARVEPDHDVRAELYRQFQEKWADLAPSVVLLYPQYLYVQHKRVEGVGPAVLVAPAHRFFDVHRWRR